MRKHLVGWLLGAIWVALAVGVAAAYGISVIGGATFIFSALCLLALGAIGLTLGSQVSQPTKTVQQILYETEHPTLDQKKRAA